MRHAAPQRPLQQRRLVGELDVVGEAVGTVLLAPPLTLPSVGEQEHTSGSISSADARGDRCAPPVAAARVACRPAKLVAHAGSAQALSRSSNVASLVKSISGGRLPQNRAKTAASRARRRGRCAGRPSPVGRRSWWPRVVASRVVGALKRAAALAVVGAQLQPALHASPSSASSPPCRRHRHTAASA